MKSNLYAAGFSHGQQGWEAKHPNSVAYMRGFAKGETWMIREAERDAPDYDDPTWQSRSAPDDFPNAHLGI